MSCNRSVKAFFITPLLLVATSNLGGCSTSTSTASTIIDTAAVLAESPLPKVVAETSGLVCLPDGSFLTINDSGNDATVFQLNNRGEVLQQFAINASNRDWEGLTVHQQKLWIGDIGNNSGARTGGDLYQTSLELQHNRLNTAEKISFVYPDLPLAPLQRYQHDFDAEAIVSANDQLLLFNKAWQSDESTVYLLETTANTSTARNIGQIKGLPGVITDGAFSEQFQVFVLTGYARFRDNMLNLALNDDYRPFLAVVDHKFNLQRIVPIAQAGQLEAICIDPQQHIWLSQEQSKRRPALLWRWGHINQLVTPNVTGTLTN
jgi:hypothetical protein